LQIINKIRGSALRHRQFKLLTSELDSKFSDVLYFNNVRWLSCGQVLNRFYDLLPEIETFLTKQNFCEELEEILTDEWKEQFYFMCDITKHLNELNLKLQGKQKFIWKLFKDIFEFKLKLGAFKDQLAEDDFTFFSTLNAHKKKIVYRTELFVQSIEVLIEEFESRFSDFSRYEVAFKFFKHPFIFDKTHAKELSEILNVRKTHLEFDLSLVASETYIPGEKCEAMWARLLSENSFLVLIKIVPQFLCMFGSTYVCECTFSSLARRKNKIRNKLSQENLEAEIRCEIFEDTPDFHKIALNKQCHPSH